MKPSMLMRVPLWAGVILGSPAAAQQERPVVEYAVKFVCGRPVQVGTVMPPVAPGTYFTAINVHNPNGRTLSFRKKFAVALPLEREGEIRGFFEAQLGPDRAMEIDCQEILRAFRSTSTPAVGPTRPRFLKGFAVIQLPDSAVELDVVGVYTAAGATGQVEALEIERVPARRITIGLPPTPRLPDLVPVGDSLARFCTRDSLGRLLVTVRNQGAGPAPASTTIVTFSPGGSVSIPTPPLPISTSVTLPPVAIPPACFDSDCDFRIVVDATGVVPESDEGNNAVAGSCLG